VAISSLLLPFRCECSGSVQQTDLGVAQDIDRFVFAQFGFADGEPGRLSI
jgi:hypothetical protein